MGESHVRTEIEQYHCSLHGGRLQKCHMVRQEIVPTIGDLLFKANLDKTKQPNMSNMYGYKILYFGMVNTSDFSPKGYTLCFQHQHGYSTPSATLVPGNLIPSFGLLGHLEHVHSWQQNITYIYTYIFVCFIYMSTK